ncbi:hypothetical protein [Pedobacter glucosidilyticus]|uniref:hypothetical protein n=1 Tax=Pedobacter glucosidilyticus TaxID=1122941 RepID=UPI0012DEC58B|nr:hypothetical protein [Pedobacter glucosidilyticus]
MKQLLYILISIVFFTVACNKNDVLDTNPNLRLNFSTDSILFDTVFTERGTVTRILKIFNYNTNSININELKLSGGNTSNFSININGLNANEAQNIRIKGNDSVYVFIRAFINPNLQETPFIVEDSLLCTFNGNKVKIPLIAYGQNAIYLKDTDITENTTFTKSKPYIVYNQLKISKNATLNIAAGARIYFHKDAKLLVHGTLTANGTLQDSIAFASDRLERIYKDEPGQWSGIHILPSSSNNIINYSCIKNAIIGVQVDSLSRNSTPKILISNTIIKNHQVAGILAYQGDITGYNNLFFNCGQYLLAAINGGRYEFYQNTFAAYNFSTARTTPAVYLADHSYNSSTAFNFNAIFKNNIIWGVLREELEISRRGNNQIFNQNFEANIIRSSGLASNTTINNNNFLNLDPTFINPREGNYKTTTNSAARSKGINLSNTSYSLELTKDIKNITRVYPSTLGCYED